MRETKYQNVPMAIQTLLCLALAQTLAAQPGNSALVLPKNSEIDLAVMETVSTNTASKGSSIRFAVAKDVVINGVAVIPAGTPVTGIITKAKRGIAYRQWPELRIHVKEVVLSRNLRIPLSPRRMESRQGSGHDLALCITFFVVCLALKNLDDNGWGEDGPSKPDQSSGQQGELRRCVVVDFWTLTDKSVPRSGLPSDGANPTAVRIDCSQMEDWSEAYQNPGLGRVFFR